LRILLVNWQDRENPQAGGAETHLHEIFGRLASEGHEISLLCGGWPGCPPRAVLDGIDVTRVGTRNTFRLRARGGYREHFAHRPFDVLVEDINKMPLHTPHWGRVPVVGLVPHLFGSTAFQELSVPIATAVWLAERPIPVVYRHTPFEAISESTADDLVERGIRRERIRVIYCGIDSDSYTPDPAARADIPVFAYLGRLKRYKAVDLVLRAFARAAIPGARLEVAGAGDYRPVLERLASSLDLGDRVTFLGRISEAEKLRLLRRAWALVFTSPKEGWGITNLEAAACGTAVIASDSPGIRESVRHGETGYLVRHGDIDALAATMKQLAADRALVEQLGEQGRRFAQAFTWERAASETARHLDEVIAESRLGGGG
jgi:glycosyltransferase involved in cell wall biosynthesis